MAKYSCIIKKHKNSLYGFNTIVKIGQEHATISEWLQKILSNQLEILYNQKIDISKTDDQINGTIKFSWDGDDSTEWASKPFPILSIFFLVGLPSFASCMARSTSLISSKCFCSFSVLSLAFFIASSKGCSWII